MDVLTVFDQVAKGSYIYTVMGYNDKPSVIHINNHKTNNNSVIVPIEVLKGLINDIPID